ncbi:hypothetical protein NKH14_28280 [Mesorhizobium sp. M1380]|uniref:hypothetical protein n=1 Tax=Mesorhizobium sp. M1380 TaxID=2957093 RepID=UPI00333726CE
MLTNPPECWFSITSLNSSKKRDDEPNGEIIIVPCANPIGLSQRLQGYHAGRSDLGVGGNFNRNFPDVSNLLDEELSRLRREDHVMDERAD